MLRRLLILTVMTALCSVSYGQIRLGIGFGRTLSDTELSEGPLSDGETAVDSDGYFADAFLRIRIAGPLFIQPEAQYTFRQSTLDLNELSEITFRKLDIPVLAGLSTGGRIIALRIGAGPVLNVASSGKSGIQTVRWTGGIGADILNTVGVDIRYNGRFSGDSFHDGSLSYDFWSFGLSLAF